jgi:hypothetical protein
MDRRGSVIERLETNVRHWREECGKLHAQNAELVAALKEASFWLKTCGHWDVAKRSDDAAAAAGHTQV